MKKVLLPLLLSISMAGCVSADPVGGGKGIDQEPMYGGMDRLSVPELKAADEKLILDTSQAFGSREIASERFVEQGIRYYQNNDYSMAMKRFNQAWLLNPSNPEVFWGFAMVYHDEGEVSICKAKDMIDRAMALNLSKHDTLADAGRIYTLCGITDYPGDPQRQNIYFTKSDELYERANTSSPNNGYVLSSWATAYYWRGNYEQSWELVAKARKSGSTFPESFLSLLGQNMPDPKLK